MRYLYSLLLATSATLAANRATAQAIANTDTGRIKEQQLQPVEVRALRAGSNAPFASTNVTAADIGKQNLGQDLPILLQYTPSAVTTSDAGTGIGYTGLRIRGTDATRTNATLNGVPLNDAEDQGVYFVDIPDVVSSTGSIQIQRGVGTSTNGAGAFGATVSISNLQQMDSAGAVFSSSCGSFNSFKNTFLAGTGMLKDGWQFDVRLSKITSDGYIQRSASDLKSLQFTAGWKASERTWFHFMLMTGTEKTGQAWDGVPQDSLKTNRTYNELGLKADGTYYNNQTDNYQQDYYQLFADHKFTDYLTAHIGLFLTRGKGYYNEYKTAESFSAYGLPNFITPGNDTFTTTDLTRQLWLDNYYYGSVFSLLYQKNKTQLTFGGGWTQYEGLHYGNVTWAQNGVPDDYQWYRHDDQKNDFNAYLKLQQYAGEKWIFFGDVQYRNVAYFINGFQDNPELHPDVNYNFFNPKAGITYLLRNTASQRQKLYASFAVANREPNYSDLEVDPAMLPKPETLYDAEAGYEMNKRKWSVSANLYYMYYNNQLVLTGQINDVGAYTQTNAPTSYRAGIELQGAVMPLRWLSIQANTTLSQNKINNFTEYLDDYEGENYSQKAINHGMTDIAFSPNVVSAANITFIPFHGLSNNQNLELSVIGKYVGRQFLDNTSNTGRMLNAYGFCNVLIRYSVKVRPFREVDATLALNNITNYLYENNGYTYSYIDNGSQSTQNYYFPQAGFHALGGITLKW